jgi:hypothetical protein
MKSLRRLWVDGLEGLISILKSARAAIRERQRKAEFTAQEDLDLSSPPSEESAAEEVVESKHEPVERILEKDNQSEIQAQIQKLSDEISLFETRYICHLEEGDFCKIKELRKARFELHVQHGAILNCDPISLCNHEVNQNSET